MRHIVSTLIPLSCAAAISSIAVSASAEQGITLIGTGIVSGTAKDGLKLTPATLEDNVTPHDQIGGFGSAIAYTGVDNLYLATPDRGPADGATTYNDRSYLFSIAVNPGAATPVAVALEEANVLVDEKDRVLTGSAAAFSTGLRFDPEGIRLDGKGGYLVSDEYGPFVYRFSADGERTAKLSLPAKFAIAKPAAIAADELPPNNTSGRQSNRGMEGLAISPDGSKLYGMMQNALIQDGALDVANKRVGLNNRLVQIDLASKATREFVYQIDKASLGVNEILAINDHEFLAIERDGNAGAAAAFKKLVKFDITGASDVSKIAQLPTSGLPQGVTPVTKTAFLDLLSSDYALAGEGFPEKIEGIAFGPRLADGRVLLIVTSDNDFFADKDSKIFVFAVDASKLAWQPQTFEVPALVKGVESWNKLNGLRGKVVPVAFRGQALLPVSALDQKSLRLGDASVANADGKLLCTERQLDNDGISDLLCAFPKKDVKLGKNPDVKIVGLTTTGTPITGKVPTRDCER